MANVALGHEPRRWRGQDEAAVARLVREVHLSRDAHRGSFRPASDAPHRSIANPLKVGIPRRDLAERNRFGIATASRISVRASIEGLSEANAREEEMN